MALFLAGSLRRSGSAMAKNQENQGGPTRNPKDEPRRASRRVHNRAQAQSKPEGDDERRNREGVRPSRRTGSQSNAS